MITLGTQEDEHSAKDNVWAYLISASPLQSHIDSSFIYIDVNK